VAIDKVPDAGRKDAFKAKEITLSSRMSRYGER